MEEQEENSEAEELIEPQITSSDPNERILARRLRIKKRLQAAKGVKKHHPQTSSVDNVEEVDDRTLLEKQLDNSEDQLEKLLLEGKELVTNVRVANDAREVKRRENEVAARRKRLQRIEDETNASMEQYDEVNSKWEVILGSNDPLDLHHAIEQQKEKCAELIAQKDVLIKELKKELKVADEHFDKDQKKQKEDLWTLAERIDNQVKVMKRAYKQELKLIEDVMEFERAQLVEMNNKKWEALYHERKELEVKHMNLKFEAVDEHEDEIYRVTVEHQERFREMKIKLETDIQCLEQELEQVKAQCLMNSEKLVYNFQVLKKREEENLIVHAQQKRRITRLQDVVNTLRKKIAEIDKSMQTESSHLTGEIVKLHHNIVDIQNKSEHFAEVNDQKYRDVWNLNKESAHNLLDKVLDIDRLLHEQQLGLDWIAPKETLLKEDDLQSYRSAMRILADIFTVKEQCESERKASRRKTPTTKEEVEKWYAQDKMLRQILELLAENSDFLLEQRLKDLLKPFTENEKTLVKLENVFTALGLKSETDLMMLKKYFLNYAKCTVCKSFEKIEGEIEGSVEGSQESINSTVTSASEDTATAETGLAESIILKLETSESSVKIEEAPVCDDTHPKEIEPALVLRALREFATKFAPCNQPSQPEFATDRITMSRLINVQDVKSYWARFREIFTPQREKLWDGLLLGLQKYHPILEDRHTLNCETEELRRQNAELRRLLHTYIQGDSFFMLTSRDRLPPLRQKTSVGRKSFTH